MVANPWGSVPSAVATLTVTNPPPVTPPTLDAAAMTAITTLIGIFSFIPLSLGINEVSISSFLVYFKQDIPVAQAGALIIRGYSVITLIMGFVMFIIWKLVLRRKMDSDYN